MRYLVLSLVVLNIAYAIILNDIHTKLERLSPINSSTVQVPARDLLYRGQSDYVTVRNFTTNDSSTTTRAELLNTSNMNAHAFDVDSWQYQLTNLLHDQTNSDVNPTLERTKR